MTVITSLCSIKCRQLTGQDSEFHEARHCVGMTREFAQKQVESKENVNPICEYELIVILLSVLYSVMG
jgi:hypothetical protein